MIKKLIFILAAALALSSCASIPAEYTSPCACLYVPINKAPDGKAVA